MKMKIKVTEMYQEIEMEVDCENFNQITTFISGARKAILEAFPSSDYAIEQLDKLNGQSKGSYKRSSGQSKQYAKTDRTKKKPTQKQIDLACQKYAELYHREMTEAEIERLEDESSQYVSDFIQALFDQLQ